ncbi:MAG: sulfite exporter TauE/SafE family protein [Thermoproteota archaeon]|nr:MAG: sulfite exporter TauE/SafE family protein [Candidatus Korarchaeota archaeon]
MDTLLLYAIIGFLAQLIDGALGMAYGVSSTTALISAGLSPAIASASVHTAEIFTTLASGISHLKAGNVDWRVSLRLLVPGIVSGALGAYLCSTVGSFLKPFVSLYLFAMGSLILIKALRRWSFPFKVRNIPLLGAVGGFFDAVGGGGWGPIVTSTLLAGGQNPQITIGSVNLAEFFVTVTEVVVFSSLIGLKYWDVVIGLILGGVAAAPLAAYTCKKLPARLLMIITASIIITLSLRNFFGF